MIGQQKLKDTINSWMTNNTLPRFLILQGKAGSGKHTLSKYIAKQTRYNFALIDNKVDSIRNMISMAYTQARPIIYCVENCQDMSVNAKNSLLKICEEPCEMAYIILMSTDDSMLDTLKSRSVTLKMEPYSLQEKQEYLSTKQIFLDKESTDNILEIAENLGQIDELLKIKEIKEFVNFVNKVMVSLDKASLGNALKITNSIRLKQDSEGYDCFLFLQTLKYCYHEQAMQNKNQVNDNYKKIVLIDKSLYELKNNKYNSQAILDCLIMQLKGA